jgi:hypothetical protein
MSRSWLLGSLTGSAICMATALPFTHIGSTAATGQTAATSATGSNGIADQPAQTGLHPVYRFPTGGPYPNPTNMPGHLRPYATATGSISSGGATNGLHKR